MNKLDLIKSLSLKVGIKRPDAKAVVEIFFDQITQGLINGDRVELRGLWSFYMKPYKPYVGRNPRTGLTVQVQPKRLTHFKCGKELRDRLNPHLADTEIETDPED